MATDRPLDVPSDSLSRAPSTGASINIFLPGVGVGLTHIKNLMIKKLWELRETNGLELEQEEVEPTIGRNFKTKFEIANEFSENILITDSDFILSDRTSSIFITADMSFIRLEADVEYQNVELLFRQRPGMGGVAALPSSVSQVPSKYLFIFGEASQREEGGGPRARGAGFDTVKGLSCGKGIKEVSIPVYDPNRGGLDPRELYAILLVVFAKTEKSYT